MEPSHSKGSLGWSPKKARLSDPEAKSSPIQGAEAGSVMSLNEITDVIEKCMKASVNFKQTGSYVHGRETTSILVNDWNAIASLRESIPEPLLASLICYVLNNVTHAVLYNNQIKDVDTQWISLGENSFTNTIIQLLHASNGLKEHRDLPFELALKAIKALVFTKGKPIPIFRRPGEGCIENKRAPIVLWIDKDRNSPRVSTNYCFNCKSENLIEQHEETSATTTSTGEMEIVVKFADKVILKHETSSTGLFRSLKLALNAESTDPDSQPLIISGKPISEEFSKQYVCPQGLVYCSIDNSERLQALRSPSAMFQKALNFADENRYGSVVIRFKSKILTPNEEKSKEFKFYKLGTKKYYYEHSQSMLIAKKSRNAEDWMLVNLSTNEVTQLEELDLPVFEWPIKFSMNGYWTHPEIVFEGKLEILPQEEECLIRFKNDHKCVQETKCLECSMRTSGKVSLKIITANKEVTFESFSLSDLDSEYPLNLARSNFAMTVPLNQRRLLQKLKYLFLEEDFLAIEKTWETYPNFHFRFLDC